MPVPRSRLAIPHIWHTTDPDGGDCRHLAMGPVGAEQAYLLHHGMTGMDGITAVDEGPISSRTERGDICFDPLCVLYGLCFEREAK